MAQPFGTQAPQTIVEINKDLFFLASTRNRGVRVVHMSNLRAEVISTPDLDMIYGLFSLEGRRHAVFGGDPVSAWSS